MSKVNTDRKLALVKAIRMQNQYDRQLLRMREGLLYSDLPEKDKAELYSLEEMSNVSQGEKTRPLKGFRVRFVVAVLLLAAFILCDVNNISIGKENADTLFARLKSSAAIEDMIDRIK